MYMYYLVTMNRNIVSDSDSQQVVYDEVLHPHLPEHRITGHRRWPSSAALRAEYDTC
jgi:hypothetical protein